MLNGEPERFANGHGGSAVAAMTGGRVYITPDINYLFIGLQYPHQSASKVSSQLKETNNPFGTGFQVLY